jgi:hypothetical protein
LRKLLGLYIFTSSKTFYKTFSNIPIFAM